jgi:hypothetical protein
MFLTRRVVRLITHSLNPAVDAEPVGGIHDRLRGMVSERSIGVA